MATTRRTPTRSPPYCHLNQFPKRRSPLLISTASGKTSFWYRHMAPISFPENTEVGRLMPAVHDELENLLLIQRKLRSIIDSHERMIHYDVVHNNSSLELKKVRWFRRLWRSFYYFFANEAFATQVKIKQLANFLFSHVASQKGAGIDLTTHALLLESLHYFHCDAEEYTQFFMHHLLPKISKPFHASYTHFAPLLEQGGAQQFLNGIARKKKKTSWELTIEQRLKRCHEKAASPQAQEHFRALLVRPSELGDLLHRISILQSGERMHHPLNSARLEQRAHLYASVDTCVSHIETLCDSAPALQSLLPPPTVFDIGKPHLQLPQQQELPFDEYSVPQGLEKDFKVVGYRLSERKNEKGPQNTLSQQNYGKTNRNGALGTFLRDLRRAFDRYLIPQHTKNALVVALEYLMQQEALSSVTKTVQLRYEQCPQICLKEFFSADPFCEIFCTGSRVKLSLRKLFAVCSSDPQKTEEQPFGYDGAAIFFDIYPSKVNAQELLFSKEALTITKKITGFSKTLSSATTELAISGVAGEHTRHESIQGALLRHNRLDITSA
jgi:hypothetical protein